MESCLAAAADPANHPLLQPRRAWIKVDTSKQHGGLELGREERSGGGRRGVIPYGPSFNWSPLVHAETPAGHPSRAAMPALIKQATKCSTIRARCSRCALVHLPTSAERSR